MVWARFGDETPDHPKLVELGDLAPLAGYLWFAATCYCCRYLTDGYITQAQLERLWPFKHIELATGGVTVNAGGQAAAEASVQAAAQAAFLINALVRVGLLTVCSSRNGRSASQSVDQEYEVHDFLVYNPSRADVMQAREKKAKAGRAGGQASAQARAQATVAPLLREGLNSPSPSPSDPSFSSLTPSEENTTRREEAPREEKKKKDAPSGFEAFWAVYPSKTGKDAARRAWLKRHPDADLTAVIVAAVERQKTWPRWQEGIIPNPATWINQGRWQDEPSAPTSPRLTPKTQGNAAALSRFARKEPSA